MKLLVLFFAILMLTSACEEGHGGRAPEGLGTVSFFSLAICDADGENVFATLFSPFEFEVVDSRGDTVDIDSRRQGINGFHMDEFKAYYNDKLTLKGSGANDYATNITKE